MATTPSTSLSVGIVTRGLTGTDPLGGGARATRGYITRALTVTPPPETVPEALLTPEITDENGIPVLVNSDIQTMAFVEVYRSPFFHPHSEYTGYAANGFWHVNGVIDPTATGAPGGRFQATWASEGEGEGNLYRGPIVKMPRRILVIGTLQEVVILDADRLNVWMRFVHPAGAPPGNGNFLGSPGCFIRGVDFGNGYLVVATSDGLRIANFRTDEAYLYRSADSQLASGPLEGRNGTSYFDGTPIAETIGDNDCRAVDIGNISQPVGTVKDVQTLCALGHAAGLDGIVLFKQGSTYPSVKNTVLSIVTGAAWAVQDDLDGDLTSPYLIDAGTDWVSQGFQAGDVITTDLPSIHRIEAVEQTVPGSRLKLSPELPITANGLSYGTQRHVPAVHVSLAGALHFASGDASITRVTTTDWFEGSSPLFTQLRADFPTAGLSAVVGAVNDMDVSGDGSVYVASDIGVFFATADAITERRLATFRYSTALVTDVDAEFKVLEGEGTDCLAVVVDVETGDVAVSVDTGELSVVTEINTSIHHPFRFFDQVGKVRAMVSYRNPDGPPDEEV